MSAPPTTQIPRDARDDIAIRPSSVALWCGVLAGPVAWALDLELRYMLVGYACAKHASWLLPVIGLAMLLLPAFGVVQARRGSRLDVETQRVRFMAMAGYILCIFSALAILASDIPDIFLRACD